MNKTIIFKKGEPEGTPEGHITTANNRRIKPGLISTTTSFKYSHCQVLRYVFCQNMLIDQTNSESSLVRFVKFIDPG
jgi:uncharacterized Fe-S radical SAM superfamily protein PflX